MASPPASVRPAVLGTDRGQPRRSWWLGLLIVGWFNLLSALSGGIGLLFANGLGMPLYLLDDSPFDSFIVPGLILLLIVGGTQALAVLLQHRRHPWFPAAAGVAGFGMIIWIYVEVALLPGYAFLMTLYFSTAVLQLVFLLLCLGILPAGRASDRPK
ncbi:hypothetical protein E3T61_09660 [Cryobacterium lactosi]|uniref:Uncharacterized protein n=1 Tax=Cryobacterium lactosi TaxID=1259202 RepID=A0A4R9BUS4_9MICO|nr:hypothetical protein [Cryobacterium lactosi]TFD91124.1 hypothetical protein E3T61_09660 [Cryobacterium lactosi]